MSGTRTKSASARINQRTTPGRLENQAKRSSTAGGRPGARPKSKNQVDGGSSTSAVAKPSARLNAKTINPVSIGISHHFQNLQRTRLKAFCRKIVLKKTVSV